MTLSLKIQDNNWYTIVVGNSPVVNIVAKPITDIKTYVILLGCAQFRPMPKLENVMWLGHLATGRVTLLEESPNEQYHWGGPHMPIVTREFVMSKITTAQQANPFAFAKSEKNSSSSASSAQTVFEKLPYADDPAMEWEEVQLEEDMLKENNRRRMMRLM